MIITNPNEVVRIALSQVGVKEQPRGSNKGPQVDRYTGGNAVPWCALFCLWVYREAKCPIPGDFSPSPGKMPPMCNVEHFERVFKEHDWHYMAPKEGDLVFFSHRGNSDRGPGRHIGIVVKVELDRIQIVDGNWGDSVRNRWVRLDCGEITGFGRMG